MLRCRTMAVQDFMGDVIRFVLGDAVREIRDVSPTTTVLEWLRGPGGLRGTKEGCAEGDCGACTVALVDHVDGRIRYRAVNACILFVPALHGRRLVTVEHLGGRHPVQTAMVAHHGSQCGFCTPGFVMSLFVLAQEAGGADRMAVTTALSGNLCRCTGYRPIIDAGLAACATSVADDFQAMPILDASCDGTLEIEHDGRRMSVPQDLETAATLIAARPEALILAGGTDIGLWVTKQHRNFADIIALDRVPALKRIEIGANHVQIGAGASYEEAFDVLAEAFPTLGDMITRLGSRQIRNSGTIGGNIGNASPIGDMAPVLMALGASLVLRHGATERTVDLEGFFTGYRKTLLRPGEFIIRIDIPRLTDGAVFRVFKISKRFDQDISAVCAAFLLERHDDRVTTFRTGFGGMAATPARARGAEAALAGHPWTEPQIRRAITALDDDFSPLSDMRATAEYRRLVARNLLLKFYIETAP